MPRPRTATHGTQTLYKYGCRCAECVTGKSRRDAEYLSRRRAELRQPGGQVVVPSVLESVGDQHTGEVPMTAGQRKLAEILATNLRKPEPSPIRSSVPSSRVDEDVVTRVPAGEE